IGIICVTAPIQSHMLKSSIIQCSIDFVGDAKMMSEKELENELKSLKLTKSQMIVLKTLRKNGRKGTTPKQLIDKIAFAPRTIRYALRKLLKKNLIKRIPCLLDMRQWIYIAA
ncbi:MAG: hypothetical protein ACXAB6_05170, partial [Candidatus Thorarchaeota archaeon]